jgi:hypothetical protein
MAADSTGSQQQQQHHHHHLLNSTRGLALAAAGQTMTVRITVLPLNILENS